MPNSFEKRSSKSKREEKREKVQEEGELKSVVTKRFESMMQERRRGVYTTVPQEIFEKVLADFANYRTEVQRSVLSDWKVRNLIRASFREVVSLDCWSTVAKAKQFFQLIPEELPEVSASIVEKVVDNLKEYSPYVVAEDIPEDERRNPAVREQAAKVVKERANRGVGYREAYAIGRFYGLPEELFFNDAFKKGVVGELKGALFAEFDELQYEKSLRELSKCHEQVRKAILSDQEVRRRVRDLYIHFASRGDWVTAKGIEPFFQLLPEGQQEMEVIVREALVGNLQEYMEYSDFTKVVNKHIPEGSRKHPVVQKQAVIAVKEHVKNKNAHLAQGIGTFYGLPREVFLNEFFERVVKPLQYTWDWDDIFNLKESFSIPESFMQKVVREYVAEKGWDAGVFMELLTMKSTDAQTIQEIFTDEQEIHQLVEAFLEKIENDSYLAEQFVYHAHKYLSYPWAEEAVLLAVSRPEHSKAAQYVWWRIESKDPAWQQLSRSDEIRDRARESVDTGKKSFVEKDPYENHPWLFDNRKVKIASIITRILAGKGSRKELKQFVDPKDSAAIDFQEVEEKIDAAYQTFLTKVRFNPNIQDEEKQALLDPEDSPVKMTPLRNNVRSFVARFLAQSMGTDEVLHIDIGALLKKGFEKFLKVFEIDIPLYDKVYKEFDELRKNGRRPTEVFLGRDGSGAHSGRRAQDVARRREMGWEERKRRKEAGESVGSHQRYTTYPTPFREGLTIDAKRQYAEQERISLEFDPIFFDTGYAGSIPEDIMRIMGFSEEEIEKRIRLLSASAENRRVKGVPDTVRDDIVEEIEHNAKEEKTAEGLLRDKETGIIRHIAEPEHPEQQFLFMMVKQAITRHYWFWERYGGGAKEVKKAA